MLGLFAGLHCTAGGIEDSFNTCIGVQVVFMLGLFAGLHCTADDAVFGLHAIPIYRSRWCLWWAYFQGYIVLLVVPYAISISMSR